ncbi:MAG: hypothetical protein PHQ00_06860, partial [Phycisphaerae bacterium]|nr:hypothetical protein [Phycisphaerae bacterium]
FSISAESEQQDSPDWSRLTNLIAQQCAQRNLTFSEVSVALDCDMFMQHEVHSSFDSPKQISSTIRFDTEEALATDISDVAIGFEVTSSGSQGSELNVFTVRKNLLSEIITALAGSGLDATGIEPDVICLSRFINAKLPHKKNQDAGLLFAMLSKRNCYFIAPFDSKNFQRTLLISQGQNRLDLLAAQVPITTALLSTGRKITHLDVWDSTNSLDAPLLQQRLGLDTTYAETGLSDNVTEEKLSQCADKVEFAIAFGAAVGLAEKQQTTNFRNDYMPYLGRKRKLEKTLKVISISAIIVFIALGLSLQVQLIQKNKPIRQLRKKLAEDYSDVMPGKKMPDSTAQVIKNLQGEIRRIRSIKNDQIGSSGEGSVSAKLAAVLAAFNSDDVTKHTNLNIEMITITGKNRTIRGDTSSRANTLKLLQKIREKMDVQQEQLGNKENRDTFSITVVPKAHTRQP